MKSRVKPRIIAILILGTLATVVSYRFENSRHVMGKEAFLAFQADRFDKYYATLHPVWHYVVAWMLIAGLLFAMYELLAFGIQTVVQQRSRQGAA